jgi:glycosyltransferase involved in cell wall biosynthesis
MPGFINEEDLPSWYSAAEVFVYPSVYEGFGMPIIEAMACGCPVVVSDTSSLPEAVGNAGVLIPATDVNAWCNAIHNLLSAPSKLEELSRHSQAQAATFSWNKTARDTVSTYWRALGTERDPHAA